MAAPKKSRPQPPTSSSSDSDSDSDDEPLPPPTKSSKKHPLPPPPQQPTPASPDDEPLPPPTKSSKKHPPPPPPQQPTLASSSSSEEESESESSSSDEEQPTENNSTPLKLPSKAQPLPEAAASESSEEEESDEEEEEEDEERKAAPFASQLTSATKSQPKEQSFSKTDASESSESDSDEPSASQPTKQKGIQEPSASRKLFQRVWTAADEVTLLKRLLEFKNLHGKEPSSVVEFEAFHEFVKDSLDGKFSRVQLTSKKRNLRKKFGTNLGRMEKGGKVVEKEHEQICFELSKKLWGAEGGKVGEEEDAAAEKKSGKKRKGKELPKVEIDASSRKKSSTNSDVAKVGASRKKIKGDAEPSNANVATSNGAFTVETKLDVVRPENETLSGVVSHRFLSSVVDQIDDSLKNVGEHGWLKAQMVHLKPEMLMSLERKCIDQYRNELKVNRMRNRLYATVIKALEEQGLDNGPSSDSGGE